MCLDTQLCLTLSKSMDCSLPGSSDTRILPLWILKWVAIFSSSASSWLRDWTRIFITRSTWEAPMTIYTNIILIASCTFFIFMVWKVYHNLKLTFLFTYLQAPPLKLKKKGTKEGREIQKKIERNKEIINRTWKPSLCYFCSSAFFHTMVPDF